MLFDRKFLLCRPLGGFNDILCQIEKCCKYAENYNRILIIDTQHTIHREFEDYFTYKKKNLEIIFITNEFLTQLNKVKDIKPLELFNRLYDYKTTHGFFFESKLKNNIQKKIAKFILRLIEKIKNYNLSLYFFLRRLKLMHIHTVDTLTKVPITFDFSSDHPEKLLIHHQFGGGEDSLHFLKRVILNKKYSLIIQKKIEEVSYDYFAIHIRNTDYKTSNYINFINLIKTELIDKNVLLCSDDANTIEISKNILKDSNIFYISKIPSTNSLPLHKLTNHPERKKIAEETLIDLFMMALSKKVYITNTDETWWSGSTMSGYSRLAENLQKDKTIIKSLVNI